MVENIQNTMENTGNEVAHSPEQINLTNEQQLADVMSRANKVLSESSSNENLPLETKAKLAIVDQINEILSRKN